MNNEIINNQANIEEDEISIQDILRIIKKHLVAIIIFVAVGLVLGFGYGEYKDIKSPKYTASASILVTADSNAITDGTTTQYQLSYYLMKTYNVFVKEDAVMDKVKDKVNAMYESDSHITSSKIKSNFTSAINGDSLIINVTYTASSEEEAYKTLNIIMDTSIEIANLTEADGTPKYKLLNSNLSVLTEASKDHTTKKSDVLKMTGIGLAAGVVLAFLYVLLLEVTNNKFSSINDVEKELGVPVLAGIPEHEFKDLNGGNK